METSCLQNNKLYAGFIRRFAAFCIDAIVLIIVNTLVASLVLAVIQYLRFAVTLFAATTILPMITFVLLFIIYFTVLDSSKGTVGKRILRIQVAAMDESKLNNSKSLIRAVGKLVSIFMLFGYLFIPFTSKKQALHDFLVNSIVIRT